MNRIIPVFFLGALFFFSCDKERNKESNVEMMQNQLVITAKGDTLENGFWTYETGASGVSSSGNYEDGYKVGQWIYKTGIDSSIVSWRTINDYGVKLNVPDYFKPIENVEPPALFYVDIPDNDENTYMVLLRYNLSDLNSSIYDYLYQYNESWKNNTNESVKAKEFKKFTFKRIEIFRATVVTEGVKRYEAISYVFVVNNFLYDLTFKRELDKSNVLESEVFNDILYSMQCDGFDLFNHNNKQYVKEENVEFRENNG